MSKMKTAALLMLSTAMASDAQSFEHPIPYGRSYIDDKPSSIWNNTKLKYSHNRTLNQRQRRKLERQMPHRRK